MKTKRLKKICPRYAAVEILSNWQASSNAVDQVRDEWLAAHPMEERRDQQLCNAILFGVLRNLAYVDFLINKFSSKPVTKLDISVLNALRVGIFQILFLDRVPVSAAINETVNALKMSGRPKWLTGFVNGILRNLLRQKDILPGLDGEVHSEIADHCRLNHPQWLYERWAARYGGEVAEKICRANNQQPPVTLRVTGDQAAFMENLAAADILAVRGDYSPWAVILPDFRGDIRKIPGFSEGLFQVQDEAPQLAAMLMGDLPSGLYLDGCAGVGGKTSHLAALIDSDSKVVALDPSEKRLDLLDENLARLGLAEKVEVIQGTVQELSDKNQYTFHGILIDAPCSGLGVIRRQPDIRWNRRAEDLEKYQINQLEILFCAAKMLMPGGVLVYATCSTEPEENDHVIEKFIKEQSDFSLDNPRQYLPESAHLLVDPKGFFRTLPGVNKADGFFAARLKKLRM